MNDDDLIRVVLIRHGKTASNLEKRYAGRRNDDPLCPEGIRELESIAPQFHALVGDGSLIFSGYSKRCVESARILSRLCSPKLDPLVVERLKEIDFGDFEGKTSAELADDPRYQTWLDSGGTTPFPGGESRKRFIKRTVDAIEDSVGLAFASRRETAAFVCHGGNIMAYMSHKTGGEYFDFQVPPCGGYETTIKGTANGFELISFDRVDDRLRA